MFDEKKDSYEQERRRKAAAAAAQQAEATSTGSMAEIILGLLTPAAAEAPPAAAAAAASRPVKAAPTTPEDGKSDVPSTPAASPETEISKRGKTASQATAGTEDGGGSGSGSGSGGGDGGGGSPLRRRTPSAAATQTTRDGAEDKPTAQKSMMKSKAKQSSASETSTTLFSEIRIGVYSPPCTRQYDTIRDAILTCARKPT